MLVQTFIFQNKESKVRDTENKVKEWSNVIHLGGHNLSLPPPLVGKEQGLKYLFRKLYISNSLSSNKHLLEIK